MSLNPKQFHQQQLFDDAPYDDGPRRDPGAVDTPEPAPVDTGYQTRMLWPTKEVIDNVHKIDSGMFDDGYSEPRHQWEDIREDKYQGGVRRGIQDRSPIPPIRIQHRSDLPAHYAPAEPELWDGHHRLAEYERAGHTEVPVWESFDNNETGYYVQGGRATGGGWVGDPPWSAR